MLYELFIVSGTAAIIAVVHTAVGPDHYVPFIALAKARDWTILKTMVVTTICGLGHVLSSIVLGLVGVAVGAGIFKLKVIESWRGDIAAWILIIFGFVYLVWGLWRAFKKSPHSHALSSKDPHAHHRKKKDLVTPWMLFVIFVLGPCEPLIPLVMVPASRGDVMGTILVSGVFGIVTILTMTGIVLLSHFGLSKIRMPSMARYSHALSGLAILLCGGSIKFLGL